MSDWNLVLIPVALTLGCYFLAYHLLSWYGRFLARIDPEIQAFIPAAAPILVAGFALAGLLGGTPYPLLGPVGVVLALIHLAVEGQIRSTSQHLPLQAPRPSPAPAISGHCRECSAPILETMDECPCCSTRRPLALSEPECLPLPASRVGLDENRLPRPASLAPATQKQNGCPSEEEQPLSGFA